jgi:vanillate O-demethylase monooxygenase subunit
MPLSLGEVVGNNLRCEYHGMVFDGAGRCVEIPNQPHIPAKAKVRSFPDRGGRTTSPGSGWLSRRKAKPEEIVRYPFHTTWPYKCKSERLPCNYLMVSDNLLDQTHAAYVHKSTLASDADAYARAEMETVPTPDGVKFTRWMLNCIPPGIYSKAVPFKGRVDRWQEFEYVAPSCILQFTGALDVGMGAYEKGNRDGGFGLRIFYGITPETEHTCWFFWSAANGYRRTSRRRPRRCSPRWISPSARTTLCSSTSTRPCASSAIVRSSTSIPTARASMRASRSSARSRPSAAFRGKRS